MTAQALPKPARAVRLGIWVEIHPSYHSTATFGDVTPTEEPGARIFGRVYEMESSPGGRVRTVYVRVAAAANCSYGHADREGRPLAYSPGHAGFSGDVPREYVKLITDPRLLFWLEMIEGDFPAARALREAEADVAESYYRGAQLMLTVKDYSGDRYAVRLGPEGSHGEMTSVAVARWDERRHADTWWTQEIAALEEEPDDVSEVEFERWETVSGVVGEAPDLIDGLRILWSLA